MVWQIAAWVRARKRKSTEPSMPLIPEPTKGEQWKVALAWCATVMVLVTVWSILAVHRVEARSTSDPARLRALAERGELSRPGLLISTLNNYHLSGKPLPVTLVTAEGAWWSRLTFPFTGRSLNRTVQRIRAVKDERELEAMRRAAAITSLAFAEIEPLIRPGVNEAEIEETILRTFRENGATGVAFKSIVGSGANAVLPHYEKNNAVMSEGLVVIDIGCEVDHYASDMTRTFPVAGTLSEAEAHLIEIVIEAGDASRETLKPGVAFGDVHDAAAKVIEDAGFGEFFNHRVGHHVGLDVHDPGHDPLEPGMVLTIEPGIYVPEGADADPQYWNLGVRIEDTYIVTEDGWEEITAYPWCPGEEMHQPQAEVFEEEPP
jgi:Xaa-Pro aminopeptidase